MTVIKENVNLKPYHTFGIETYCRYFAEIGSIDEFLALIRSDVYQSNPKLILGGGSNLLFVKDFNGLVIRNNLRGITIVAENDHQATVRAAAGEPWHELVLWCIARGLAGLENLSLIPGCVGASPMQNIGAYGVEVKEMFRELEAYAMSDGQRRIFTREECGFGYRESVFKRQYKDQYLIASVTYDLKKQATLNTSYGAINTELSAMGITAPTIADVSRAVINIRQSKLPDPREIGNAGSFFKNPEVPAAQYNQLKAQHPGLVAYPVPGERYKLAAGWLIEQCGLKGFEMNGAAVHTKQALVLVNKHQAKGSDVFHLSDYVMGEVMKKFGVTLEREVNIIA